MALDYVYALWELLALTHAGHKVKHQSQFTQPETDGQ